jgi:hypothetical protein
MVNSILQKIMQRNYFQSLDPGIACTTTIKSEVKHPAGNYKYDHKVLEFTTKQQQYKNKKSAGEAKGVDLTHKS